MKSSSCDNGIGKMERRGNPHLRLQSQLLWRVGDGGGCGRSLLCLRAKISSGPWMGHHNVIEKLNYKLSKWHLEKGRKGEFSPVLVVAASLDCGGVGMDGGGFRLN